MRKKYFLLAVIPLLMLSSCQKEKTYDELILGTWYHDMDATHWKSTYTQDYKDYCAAHPEDTTLTIDFDEEVHYFKERYHYAYWSFSNNKNEWYYQYLTGRILQGSSKYIIQGDNLYFGSDRWVIHTLDENHLTVEIKDTTYYYDDNYNKKIAKIFCEKIFFNREFVPANGYQDPGGHQEGGNGGGSGEGGSTDGSGESERY